MRVSVQKGDPFYVSDPYNYEAFLDGRQLHNCHTADEEMRLVHCWNDIATTDCLGRKIPNRFLPLSLGSHIKRGKVEIIYKGPDAQ